MHQDVSRRRYWRVPRVVISWWRDAGTRIEFHLYADALLTLLSGLDSILIWNAWLDGDMVWLDAFLVSLLRVLSTPGGADEGLYQEIWCDTRTGLYDLPSRPRTFSPLHLIYELSDFGDKPTSPLLL